MTLTVDARRDTADRTRAVMEDLLAGGFPALIAACRALDPDGYPTDQGDDRTHGQGPADPTFAAAAAPKRGRQTLAEVDRDLVELARIVERLAARIAWARAQHVIVPDVPRQVGRCAACGDWYPGIGDDRLVRYGPGGPDAWWCARCIRARQRDQTTPLARFVAARRDRARIAPRRERIAP